MLGLGSGWVQEGQRPWVPVPVPTSSAGLHDEHFGLGSQGLAVPVVQDLEEVVQPDHLSIFALEEAFIPMGHEHHEGAAHRLLPAVYDLLEIF